MAVGGIDVIEVRRMYKIVRGRAHSEKKGEPAQDQFLSNAESAEVE